jgi:glycosyltransferase involved in cell wall biosynthesis
LGCLEHVGLDRIAGWARDVASPDRPVWLRILDNDAAIGLIVADQHRETQRRPGLGDGRCGFEIIIPGGLSPLTRHVIRVERASDGAELPTSRWVMEAAPIAATEPAAAVGASRGQLDQATRERIAGWAQDAGAPETPVALQVLDNGVPIMRVLANLARTDLAEAGIGSGRYGFDIIIPGGLSPLARHVLHVRREADGAELPGSPAVIEAAGGFDAGLRRAIANAVTAIGPDDDRDDALRFILEQADRLLQQRADAESRRIQRLAHRRLTGNWGRPAPDAPLAAEPGLRALVIDERVPRTGRDAGSQALLSHMRALQRLRYAVSFVAADEIASDGADLAALTASGVTCCAAPFYASVEDVLRRQAACFDLVYLHRAGIATRYLGLARRYMPRARILYSVADLHHVRLERQAAVEERPELLAASRRMRPEECMAAWLADGVITHSADEAELLRRAVPEARVYRVPWEVPGAEELVEHRAAAGATAKRAVSVPFAARRGLVFVGGYAHAPNVDAARWLVEAVMPLVWRADPDIVCLLVGSAMPDAVRRLARPGVVPLGEVADLGSVFNRVRLSVAPLRYGAGVKGKVLDSLAAGVPCVMTPVAAEGLGLPAGLRALVGEDAARLAALIRRLHRSEAAHLKAVRAGRVLIRKNHTARVVTVALQAAVDGRGAIEQRMGTGARVASAA